MMIKQFSVCSLACLFMVLLPGKLIGANTDTSRFILSSHVASTEIRLRWAPDDYSTWSYTSREGYVLERILIFSDGKLIPHEDTRVEVLARPRLRPLDEWEALCEWNDYALVAAQAYFGEKMQLTRPPSSPAQLMDINREQDNRFGYSLFAADLSFEVALHSGLGFVDSTILPASGYLYRVYPAASPLGNLVDTAYCYVRTDEPSRVMAPDGLTLQFNGHEAQLSWETRHLERYYAGYTIERSTDSLHFEPVNKSPFVPMGQRQDEQMMNRVWYSDSVPKLNTIYYYRIVGITYFGTRGPASRHISATSTPTGESPPEIVALELLGQEVRVQWYLPPADSSLALAFTVEVAPGLKEPYLPVMNTGNTAHHREARFIPPHASNYTRVTVHYPGGVSLSSSSRLIQTIDSIPPNPPDRLTAQIDTAGMLSISWTKNQETDLHGYKLFFAYDTGHEYSLLDPSIIKDTSFTTAVSLNHLTRHIYLKIQALDNRYNASEFSQVTKARFPDRIPPVPTVWTGSEVKDNAVHLYWEKSPSADVAHYRITRETAEYREDLIAGAGDTSLQWTITEKGHTKHTFWISTVDSSGNSSHHEIPLVVVTRDMDNKLPIQLKVRADRENQTVILSWKELPGYAGKILVYRAADNALPELMNALSLPAETYHDRAISPNTRYTYSIALQRPDGSLSRLSNEAIVTY